MQRVQSKLKLIALAALLRFGACSEQVSTPIARVVSLLKGVQTRLEEDFEAEKSLFERYECWYKSITNSKTVSNTAAQTRKDSLEQYIQDINSGKFEFTTERVDLEKQIAGLAEDLQTAQGLRNKEAGDYQAAKEEMDAAVAALDSAIQTLENAAPSSLLALRSTPAQLRAREHLQQVVQLGRSALTLGDLRFLERTIVGDVPKPDWKKLNRKATFKMNYTSQTGRIVATLKNLKTTFEENLNDALEKETAAQTSYNTLKGSKEGMKTNAETALVDLVAEHGARAMTKSEAQQEVNALGTQITDDTRFISETLTAYNAKKQEWTNRERLRQMEIAAISEAISVLHSDDARDTFTMSYSLLQAASSVTASSSRKLLGRVKQTLAAVAAVAGDARLARLAQRSGTRSIAQVITEIDSLVSTLRAEEDTDLTNKETCESDRANKTRDAKVQSIAVDDLTEEIVRAKAKVVELEGQITEQEEAIVEMNGTLVGMERQRSDENAEYLKSKADDQAAIGFIQQAIGVINKLKTDLLAGLSVKSKVQHMRGSNKPSGLTAVSVRLHEHAATVGAAAVNLRSSMAAVVRQQGTHRQQQPFDIEAGKAPPPPPATWADPTYKGSVVEHKGIAAILTMLKDDIVADVAAADQAETNAVTAYNTQKLAVEGAITAAQQAITGYDGEKATQDTLIVNKGTDRTNKKAELKGTMDELKALIPGCDFLLINYDVRTTNRHIEIDGLLKAKAYLSGANFN